MSALTAALGELRSVAGVLREERDSNPVGHVLVSGMLAEQLARLLADGSQPGAVIVGDGSRFQGSAVVVRVIAGDPSPEDDELVRNADRVGVPVVLVQLWAQADWTPPFVLSPFVVECSAGAGFPVPEIAGRVVSAVERPAALARRVPVLKQAAAGRLIGAAAVRAAILGTFGSQARAARPQITLEQVRMLAELRHLEDGTADGESLATMGGIAASVVGLGFVFRGIARNAQQALPGPLANAAVAAAGTWILADAFRRLEQHLPS